MLLIFLHTKWKSTFIFVIVTRVSAVSNYYRLLFEDSLFSLSLGDAGLQIKSSMIRIPSSPNSWISVRFKIQWQKLIVLYHINLIDLILIKRPKKPIKRLKKLIKRLKNDEIHWKCQNRSKIWSVLTIFEQFLIKSAGFRTSQLKLDSI